MVKLEKKDFVIFFTHKILWFAIILPICLSYFVNKYVIDFKYNAYLFAIVYISIAIYAVAYIVETRFQIFRPYKYLSFLYGAISFSFIIISIIFGFHTDILTYYDNKNTDTNELYWYDPVNLMSFPETRVNNKCDTVNFKNDDTTEVLNILLIDNSNSLLPYQPNIDLLIDDYNSYYLPKITKADSISATQLLTLYLINTIYSISKNNYFYLRTINDNELTFNRQEFNYPTKFHEILAKSKTDKKISSDILNFLLRSDSIINDKIINGIGPIIHLKEFPQRRYYLISDYNNSNEKLSENDLGNKLSVLTQQIKNENSKQFGFVRLKGVDNQSSNIFYSLIDKLKSDVEQPKYLELNTLNLRPNDIRNSLRMFSSPVKLDTLDFYYENLSNITNNALSVNLLLKEQNIHLNAFNNDQLGNRSKCCVQCNNKINNFHINEAGISLADSGVHKISIDNYNNVLNNKCYLELYSPQLCQNKYLLIRPNPVLPSSNATSLVLIYTVLIASLSLMFFFLFFSNNYIYEGDLSNSRYTKGWILWYNFISSVCLVPIYYYLVFISVGNNYYYKIVVLICLLLVTVKLFNRALKKIDGDIKNEYKNR